MIWDLRKRQSVYTVPAHTNLISHVKFYGKCLLKMVANCSKGVFSDQCKFLILHKLNVNTNYLPRAKCLLWGGVGWYFARTLY